MAKAPPSGDGQSIVIKRVKKVAGGHHGGAWKVAYADFVTAMMAFFLLLWLLSVTTDEQRSAISNFFDPTHPTISDPTSGAGGVMGGTALSTEGAMTSTIQEIRMAENSGATTSDRLRGDSGGKGQDSSDAQKLEDELRRREDARYEQAKKEIEEQIQRNTDLAELQKHLMIDITRDGLRIQIIDQEGEPMFPSGSAQMFDKTRRIMTLAAEVIRKMPNPVSVRGHTDSVPYRPGATYTNWELSADRANATRRVLSTTGVPEARISNVMGMADTDHLVPDKPTDARNRRISIIMEREDLESMIAREGTSAARAIGAPQAVDEMKERLKRAVEQPYRRTQGDVYFP